MKTPMFLRTRILEELHGEELWKETGNIVQYVTLLLMLFGNSDTLIVQTQVLRASDTFFSPYENELPRDSLKVIHEMLWCYD